nr:PREDICTED: cation channel sperm-associated protein 3 isoform X2 [Anolis carolinensis]|eukprot:XP_008113723.1 PREDICTED: cation channel sperm-associated protein 3 isoform X2 [Anolis carolinensis]
MFRNQGRMFETTVELPEERRLIDKLSLEAFNATSDVDVKYYVFGYRRRDIGLHKFIETLFYHPLFKSIMISTVTLNAIFLALETDYKVRKESNFFLEVTDLIILAVYTTEFLMSVYLDPVKYWQDGYKRFDFIVLLIAYLPHTIDRNNPETHQTATLLKGFQALRVLKLIYYSPGMRVDGWTDLQDELDDLHFVSSRTFTIVFILLGFFVFFNMFIAVVIMDIQSSTEEYDQKLKAERRANLIAKKQIILKRQQEEVNELLAQQKTTEYQTFDEMVEEFKKTLLHTDPVILEDFCCSLPFIDLYLLSLDRQDATIYKLQELYYEIVATLTTLLREAELKSLKSFQFAKINSKSSSSINPNK